MFNFLSESKPITCHHRQVWGFTLVERGRQGKKWTRTKLELTSTQARFQTIPAIGNRQQQRSSAFWRMAVATKRSTQACGIKAQADNPQPGVAVHDRGDTGMRSALWWPPTWSADRITRTPMARRSNTRACRCCKTCRPNWDTRRHEPEKLRGV